MAHPADDIIKAMRFHTSSDADTIRKAYDFAEKAHGDELRKSGEPYIVHPHAIAVTLAELGMNRDTVIAGILHDTTEDTDTKPEEIESNFGESVRFLVDSVTKLSKLKYRGLERHVESLRRLLVATASDIRVIIIKLADRLHNMQTIQHLPPEKQQRIALETKEVYVPIAERLGMGLLKAQLDDLAFKTLEPERYQELANDLKQKAKESQDTLEKTKEEIRGVLTENGLKKFRLESRVKNVHSYAKKLERKDGDPDKVYDIFAIRVIVPTVEDCYHALGIIHARWRPVLGRVKDFIAAPKPNGYQSLHTTILSHQGINIEIQIRTKQMQQEAKFGIASQFNYKNPLGKKNMITTANWLYKLLPSLMRTKPFEDDAESPRWLKDLTTLEQGHPEYETFEEILKQDFFAERMFAFTPNGDVIDLPVGATPVDFAYAIHSDIGDTMNGARVNQKMVSLDTPLKNGDVVEIITKKGGRPNKKWLDFAKTASAKSHIKSTLKS